MGSDPQLEARTAPQAFRRKEGAPDRSSGPYNSLTSPRSLNLRCSEGEQMEGDAEPDDVTKPLANHQRDETSAGPREADSAPTDLTSRIEELKYQTQHFEFRAKKYALAAAILGVATATLIAATAILGNHSSSQSDELSTMNHRIDALERGNSSLTERNNTLNGQVDALEKERDDAKSTAVGLQRQLDDSNARLAQLGQEGSAPSSSSNVDGGKTFEFTVPMAQFDTGVDLDVGVVGQAGSDITYGTDSGRRAVKPRYGSPLSVDLRTQDPGHAQCKDAIDRRPIAEGAGWLVGDTGAQACATSDYGVARLTVTHIADNGDLTVSEVYWVR